MSEVKNVQVDIKLYLNGFPKSGTHVLVMFAAGMLPMVSREHNWMGNVSRNAFGEVSENLTKRILEAVDVFTPNRYIKGHLAYDKRLAEAFQRNKVCKVFICRDMRDVAVSAAFHAVRGETAKFPEKDFYKSLDFDERLRRIITGDEHLVGIMDRWEEFAPWMDEDWVLKLAYEDFIEHPRGVSDLFIRYVYGKTGNYHGIHTEINRKDYDAMMERMMKQVERGPKASPTYREGKIGKWREYFTDEHKKLFKESDKNNWLIRLGYADDRNW